MCWISFWAPNLNMHDSGLQSFYQILPLVSHPSCFMCLLRVYLGIFQGVFSLATELVRPLSLLLWLHISLIIFKLSFQRDRNWSECVTSPTGLSTVLPMAATWLPMLMGLSALTSCSPSPGCRATPSFTPNGMTSATSGARASEYRTRG